MAEGKAFKLKLKVVSVGTIKEIGDKKIPMLKFTAEVVGTKPVKKSTFECWSKSAFEHIVKDAVFDVEGTYSEKKSGDNTYQHRKIDQIFIDGKPVMKKSQSGGYRSNENPDEKRRSMAIAYSKDLVVADRVKIQNLLPLASVIDKFIKGDIKSDDKKIAEFLMGEWFTIEKKS